MSGTTEAFARVKIDAAAFEHAGWNLTDGVSVLFEHALPDGTQADYVLCDRSGRPMAALEARRASTDPIGARDQGVHRRADGGPAPGASAVLRVRSALETSSRWVLGEYFPRPGVTHMLASPAKPLICKDDARRRA